MSSAVRITSLAHRDITKAALWYDRQRKGLGQRFFSDLDAVIASIAERPGSFPDVHQGMRRAQLRDFPYGVFFVVGAGEIVVLGVIDLRRDPLVWKDRHS